MSRKMKPKVRSGLEPADVAYPLADAIGQLDVPLHGVVAEVRNSIRGCDTTAARAALYDVGANRYIGDVTREDCVRGFGTRAFVVGMCTEFGRHDGMLGATGLYAAIGLEPGVERLLVEAGWPAVPPEEVAGLTDAERALAARSAQACEATPSGLRRPSPAILDDLRACVREVARRGTLHYRHSAHYVAEVRLDLGDLTVAQRVVWRVIAS